MGPTRKRASAHDPGRVLLDLAVMLADGGDCLADLGGLRDQRPLFGAVASDATAFRVIDSVDEQCLARLRGAVAAARATAWLAGARPERFLARARNRVQRTVIDVDASLARAYSQKEQAAGNFKGGYGHHPLLAYLDGTGEALARILRPGNAGSNTAADHEQVLDLTLSQLESTALDGEILIRADDAGATHELREYCLQAGLRFSFGSGLTAPVRQAITAAPEPAWTRALRPGGESLREHSWVTEITDRVDLSAWPAGSRLIARRTQLNDGDQQSFTDHDGYRLAVFITDQTGPDIRQLDLMGNGVRVRRRLVSG